MDWLWSRWKARTGSFNTLKESLRRDHQFISFKGLVDVPCTSHNDTEASFVDRIVPEPQQTVTKNITFIIYRFPSSNNVHNFLYSHQIMPASLTSLPVELLHEVVAYLVKSKRPLEIPSTFGPLDVRSRQRTIFVKTARLLKEPFAADLFALCRVNKHLYNMLSPILRAEVSFDFNTFVSVDLMKDDTAVQRDANLVRSLCIVRYGRRRAEIVWDKEEEYTSDEEAPITTESRISVFCRNLKAFSGLTSLVIYRVYASIDIMRVIAGMQDLRALSLYSYVSTPEDDFDPKENIDFPPLTSIHIWCPGSREVSLTTSLRSSLQDICFMSTQCFHEDMWERGALFDQKFPKLRSLSLGPFIKDESDALAFRRFVLRHQETLRELNMDFGRALWVDLSWIHHIVKIMCGADAEEWEGMDRIWHKRMGRNRPWGSYAATAFGCVVRGVKGHVSEGPPRQLVEFGLDLVGFGDEEEEHVNDFMLVSDLTGMFQDQVFRTIEQMVLILPEVSHWHEFPIDDSDTRSIFDEITSVCFELPHLRALSLFVYFEGSGVVWSKDDSRKVLLPRFNSPEDPPPRLYDVYYKEWQNVPPYSDIDWASYPELEGQEKLIGMWKREELANVQSLMSGLMLKCESLEIVQWWIGNQSCQCDWVWRRAEGKQDEESSETKTVSLLNDLRIPETSNAPRKEVISALVGRMADFESNLL